MLDLVKLKTFQVVAAMGSVTRAAAKLGYSQSNVTTQIKALELELGRSLFERNRFGVALTDSGRRALAYAGKLLTLEAEAKVLIHEPALPSGILHISAPESLLAYCVPGLLSEYLRLFPDVHLSVLSMPDLASQVAAVTGGAADLAVVIDGPLPEHRMNVEDLFEEEIVAVVAPNHSLLTLPPSELQRQLRSETLLCDTLHSYHLANGTWSDRQTKKMNILELGSVAAAKQCAGAGLGYAVLPLFTVKAELASGELIALALPTIEAIIQLLSPRDRALLPAAEAFCLLARQQFLGHESGRHAKR